ncbi:MAG TPA: aspartyl protease family protein, partial [Terriglobales bacterium]|nr:aspartyl protease family protein [Terriglobales bacterium]
GKPMRKRIFAALFVALVTCLPAAAAPPCAEKILAQAKQAMGGDAWDAIRTTHSQGKLATSGLSGPAESWEDNLTGRYLEKYQLGPSSGAEGFDGKQVWSQDSSGEPRAEGGENARQAAADEAYRSAMGYWYPQRWAAQIDCLGRKEEQGKAFEDLRITPQGGRPFDLWIDANTHVIDHTVEKADIETRTTYFSDYRIVNGVKVPFAVRSTNGDQKYDQYFTLEKVEFNPPIQEAMFRMPQPPPPDFAISAGKSSTTVPFELINNHIYVEVKLNDKGPFRVLCDTGGANIITPALARELGLKSEGALQGRGVGEKSEDVGLVKMESLRVGDASLSNQVFAVYPMEPFSAVEGIPINGLIGYEVFRRFVVRVDYEHHLITLMTPSAFNYKGEGTVVPFQFNAHIPQVDGAVDGIEGKLDIDTGSRASLTLLAPFAEKHDLASHYGAKLEAVTGWGVGGAARGLVTRAKVLRLGKVEILAPVTELSLQKKGAFINPYIAGNVGAGVLKRFNITFDYAHQQLIFERNANYDKPDVFDRSGMWLNQSGGTFEVMDVIAGGPAAVAGIKVGDKILAINGRGAGQLPLPAVRQQFKTQPPGTRLRLTIQSGEQKRDLELVLKDLV